MQVLLLAVSLCAAPDAGPAEQARDPAPDPRATVEGENAKHAERLAKIAQLEAIATEQKNDVLLAKIARLKEKEEKRHTRALARLSGAKRDEVKENVAERKEERAERRDERQEERAGRRDEIKKKIEEKRAEKEAKKAARKGGK